VIKESRQKQSQAHRSIELIEGIMMHGISERSVNYLSQGTNRLYFECINEYDSIWVPFGHERDITSNKTADIVPYMWVYR
jgi:hypothetical protein